MKSYKIYTMVAIAFMMCSCEKFTAEVSNTTEASANNNVALQVTERDAVMKACSRLSFGIFKVDEKIKSVNQLLEDKDFGKASLSLLPGIYRIVAIGHNGNGNCTISAPEKITFANNKMTDTYYYYGTLDVKEGDNPAQSITLQRAVSMFRLHISDDIPTNAKRIKFYYTGGSSTLDATTGYGCVNSKQTEILDISTEKKDYEIYTFPHEDGKKLKITISVMDAEGIVIASKTFEDVTLLKNHITTYSGKMFDNSPTGDPGNIDIGFTFDPKWEGETIVYFQ